MEKLIIAVDGMGGDHAPQEIIRGAVAAVTEYSDIRLILCGDKEKLSSFGELPPSITIENATKAVAMGDNPLKRAKGSSIAVGLELVKSGRACAFVSAGNTGSAMVLSTLLLGRIKGLERPAIVTPIPTDNPETGCVYLLDSGANVDCKPQHLLDFAMMGHAYAKSVKGIMAPRIGLLNIGEEEKKGDQLTRAAYALLKETELNFTGYAEANRIFEGHWDVVICDGFVGNVILKSLEAFATMLMNWTGGAMARASVADERMDKVLGSIKKKLDYREYGGAPLLGVEGISIICHGSSNARAISNAIGTARGAALGDLVGTLGRTVQWKSEA